MVWLCILCLFTYKSILVYLTCVGERFLWVHKHKHQLEIALKHADAKPFNQNWLYKHAKRLTDERHCQSCDFGCECMGLGKTYICWRVIVCSATDACFLCALALCDCRWCRRRRLPRCLMTTHKLVRRDGVRDVMCACSRCQTNSRISSLLLASQLK